MRLLPLLLLLVACDRATPARPLGPEAPPHGRGRYTDDQGQDHTLFRPLGVIRYGEERTGTVDDPRALLGYEFEARSGDEPIITLSLAKGRRGGVALYGPRGTEGLWDVALDPWVNGEGTLSLGGLQLDVPGMYFILVRSLGDGPLDYTLRLRCSSPECGEPSCPEVVACDLVCDTGYVLDADGCRECACMAGSCTPDSCPEGQRCVEGSCQEIPCAERCPVGVDPVCGTDGVTYRNTCTAECAGIEVAARGECAAMAECDAQRPCPEGRQCRSGRCVADDCGCAPVRAPVCSVEGETFANRCLLECARATFAYPGRCVPDACRSVEECDAGERCEPVADPENLRRCRQQPESLECIRQCTLPASTCGPGGPVCEFNQQCVQFAGPDQPGFCTQFCQPERGCPAEDLVCVTLPERPDVGACLPACSAEDPACPAGLVCALNQPRPVCLAGACDCPPPGPEDVVCANGREAPSECIARCFGARDIRPGPCEPVEPECLCPPERSAMVCGADGTFYAGVCDARCAGQAGARPQVCLGEVPVVCREDADCQVTGCDGSVCAAAPTEACPPTSPAGRCRVELGQCGCYRLEGQAEGTCTFEATREAAACIEGLGRMR